MRTPIKTFIYLMTAFCIILLISGCEKKVWKIAPRLETVKDMSFDFNTAIRHFSFPNPQVGYIGPDTSFILKTVDGGNTFTQIDIPTGQTECKGLAFFDELNGMCMMGSILYVTADGGESWEYKGATEHIDIISDGRGVRVDCSGFNCLISVTEDQGQSFQQVFSISNENYYLSSIKITGDIVYLIQEDTYYDDYLRGFNIITQEDMTIEFDNVTAFERPNDVYVGGGESVVVGHGGLITTPGYFDHTRSYYGHEYSYFSVDGFDDLVVCVGQNTITTNYDFGIEDEDGNPEEWTELFDKAGNGFTDVFYKIKFEGESYFYVSGENGRLLKFGI